MNSNVSMSDVRFINRMLGDKRVRYLAVGGMNTLFGYFSSLACHYALSPRLHIFFILALVNILGISFSFLTYKTLVFRTKGRWLREYLRCYVVYGSAHLLWIAGVWLMVDVLLVPFWIASGLASILTVIIAYAGHDKFSFARPNDSEGKI